MPTLTRARILATAVAMADRDGFESVTLRRLAAELGVHVTSLYNHIPTREAVMDGIAEVLVTEAKLPTDPIGWEEWVRRFFDAIGTIAATHPGAFTALQRRPVQGVAATASFEVALAAFDRAGLDPDTAYAAVKATALSALAVGIERSMLSRELLPETALDDLPRADFPHIHAAWAVEPEDAWAFALETLVSGLRAQIRARKRDRGR